MSEKIEPTNDERAWLTAHKFSCWVKDGRGWSYDGGDGLVIDLFLENSTDGKHEWMLEWYFDFGDGTSIEDGNDSGFASPEDAVARMLAEVSRIDAGGKIFQTAVAELYGKEAAE